MVKDLFLEEVELTELINFDRQFKEERKKLWSCLQREKGKVD